MSRGESKCSADLFCRSPAFVPFAMRKPQPCSPLVTRHCFYPFPKKTDGETWNRLLEESRWDSDAKLRGALHVRAVRRMISVDCELKKETRVDPQRNPMDRTGMLDQLFEEWAQSRPEYVGNFSRDGIVDERQYSEAQMRLLFILKEPRNHSDDLRHHGMDFAQGIKKNNATWRNLISWSYGILNRFPPFSKRLSDPKAPEALLKVAVLNLKKTRGGSSAVHQEILDFALDESNRDFLKREVRIIEPQVIVCCGRSTVDEPVRSILCPNSTWVLSGNQLPYLCWDGSLIVSYYHPGYHVADAVLYSYLMGELRGLLNPESLEH